MGKKSSGSHLLHKDGKSPELRLNMAWCCQPSRRGLKAVAALTLVLSLFPHTHSEGENFFAQPQLKGP